MPDLTNVQLNPPSNWQDFERLCQSLWMKVWGDPNTQRNGRGGQPQAGVDVFGLPKGEQRHAGVQCKGKDGRYGSKLTEDELLEEVRKAKSFEPPLGQFIVATTANTDANIQEVARKLTVEHRSNGLFDVVVMSWPEIEIRLAQFPEVLDAHFPHQSDKARKALDAIITIADAQSEIKGALSARGASDEALSLLTQIHQNVANLAVGRGGDELDRELGAELDHCRELIQNNQPQIALQLAEALKTRAWARANANIRFRMLTNIGAAKLSLGKESEAATDFLGAFEYDSSLEKAHANRILAFLLLGDLGAAKSASHQATEAFPKSPLVWARQIQVISAAGDPFDPATMIPTDLPNHEELLLSVGFALGRRGHFSEAEGWLRRGLTTNPGSTELKVALGDILAEEVSRSGNLYPGSQLSVSERSKLDEATSLLSDALDRLVLQENKAPVAQCAANLSTVLIVLNDPARALDVVARGLQHCPADANLLRQKIRLLLAVGRAAEAEQSLKALGPEDAKAHPVFYAEFLKQSDGVASALGYLEEFIKSNPDSEDGRVAKCAFVEECMSRSGEYKENKARAIGVLRLGTPDYRSELIFAELAFLAGDSESMQQALERARVSVSEHDDARAWTSLADALLSLGSTEEAIGIYRRHCSPLNDGPTLRRYVGALMTTDRRRELTNLLEQVPPSIQGKGFYQRVLGELAYQAGDLPRALPYFESRLAQTPADFRSRARWAEIQIALGNKAAVEGYLREQEPTNSQLTAENAVEVSRIYRAVGKALDGVRLIYETRRRFPGSEAINGALIAILLSDRDIDLPTESHIPIGIDMAFCIEHGSKRSVFVLEDRRSEDLRENEIRPDHPLALRAINLRPGDRILISQNPYAREEGVVVWVKHKFLHALHETMETFEARFPHQKALFRVPIANKDGQLEVEPILKALDARAQHAAELTKLYTDKHLPLCAVARGLGTNVLDVWRGFVSDTAFSIAVCLGTAEERAAAFRLLRSNDKGLILEPLSLHLLHSLDLLTAVQKHYGKLAITNAALDVYRNLLQERRFQREGYLSLAKVEGAYIKQEISASDIADNTKQLEKILEWAQTNCEIIPAVPKQDLEETDPRAAREFIGDAFFDTLLAANGSGRLLLSDDMYFRSMAHQSFAVEAVWTQPVLMELRAERALSGEAYVRALSALCHSKYTFTSVGGGDLLIASKLDDWTNGPNFSRLTSTLTNRNIHVSSLISVATDFLTLVWRRADYDDARRMTFALLENLSLERSAHCASFYLTVSQRLPAETFTVVRAWYEGHFLLSSETS